MYLDRTIGEKWSLDANNEEGKLYCNMPEISDEVYLHRLYRKIDKTYYDKFEKAYGIELLPELKNFYDNFNGCRLFHSSVHVYGLILDKSAPCDFALNDTNNHASLAENGVDNGDIVFFGSVGDYQAYYKQSEIKNPKIYLSKQGSLEVHKEFPNIQSMLEFYLSALSLEYNAKGYRKHPNTEKWCKKFPVIANSFNGDITWDIPESIKKNNSDGPVGPGPH